MVTTCARAGCPNPDGATCSPPSHTGGFRCSHISRRPGLPLPNCTPATALGLCSTLAFVLMPDHLHWLVQLHGGPLSDLARRFKSRSAAAINHANATPGVRLWQAGFHDHAVRDGQDIRALARYIVANPLRAGLADSVGDYPHWDAAWP